MKKRQNKKRYPLNHYVKKEYLHEKLSLALKKTNLDIDPDFIEISTIEYYNGIKTLVWHLKTSPQLHWPLCGFIMSKNGFKLLQINYDYTADHLNIISIKKQKYICSNCCKTALAPVLDVRSNAHIDLCVKPVITSELTKAGSKKYIGQRYFVSANTVERASNRWFHANTPRFTWLPQNIAFADFNSSRFAHAGMSVVLVDIRCRRAIKTVTVGLFTPYRKAIHEFRISVIKPFKSDTRQYRQLKNSAPTFKGS